MIVTATMNAVHLCPYVDEVDIGTITFVFSGAAPDLHQVAAAVDEYRAAKVTHETMTASIAFRFDCYVRSDWRTAGMDVVVEEGVDPRL